MNRQSLSITCCSPKIAKPDILCILLNKHKTTQSLAKGDESESLQASMPSCQIHRETHVTATWACSQKNSENVINQDLQMLMSWIHDCVLVNNV